MSKADTKYSYDVFIVDDEPSTLRVIAEEMELLGCRPHCFTRAKDCIAMLPGELCHLLITDIHMPGMDGLNLLELLRCKYPWIPVIVITGHGDVPRAVRAIKTGAVEFIEKPLERSIFLESVKKILGRYALDDIKSGEPLTKNERKVLRLILAGESNKEVAEHLGRSLRTAELHRSNIMHKFNAKSIAELVQKTAHIDLIEEK